MFALLRPTLVFISFGQLHEPDVRGSLRFIDKLRALTPGMPQGVALDCGAGIGRVSSSVLLERFERVEVLEPNAVRVTAEFSQCFPSLHARPLSVFPHCMLFLSSL